MRIFTNEESTVNALARAEGRVEAFAWGDPLCFGRLSPGNDLDAFAVSRSLSYAAAHWDEDQTIEEDLKMRNAELVDAFSSGEDVCLLFGGSLVDQIRLSQILGWLSERPVAEQARARLMLVDGALSVFDDGALLEIAKAAETLPAAVHAVYAIAWDAVTGPDPKAVEGALRRAESEGLSSLASGLKRWLQELPSVENGLSISQMQTLDALRLGISEPSALFDAVQSTEALPFRINWEFWQLIAELCSGESPLAQTTTGDAFLCPPKALAWEAFHAQRLRLTERGLAILEGRSNYLAGSFQERWLGGARVDAEGTCLWDYASDSVVSASGA